MAALQWDRLEPNGGLQRAVAAEAALISGIPRTYKAERLWYPRIASGVRSVARTFFGLAR